MRIRIPIPAPIPALAAAESPEEEDLVSFIRGFAVEVGLALAEAVEATVEEASDPEEVLVVKIPATVPNSCTDVSMGILFVRILATYADT
jgi:hypothetical protein